MEIRKLISGKYFIKVSTDESGFISLKDYLNEKVNVNINVRNYSFTTNNNLVSKVEFNKIMKNGDYYALRIYGLLHSDLVLSLKPFNDEYDSGIAGIIWAKKSDFENKDIAIKEMEKAINLMNDFNDGNIYTFELYRLSGTSNNNVVELEELEDISGLVGDDQLNDTIQNCLDYMGLNINDFKKYLGNLKVATYSNL